MPRNVRSLALGDLTGRTAVITGASDGVGLQIATRLAAAGADLILPVRNLKKGAAAIETIRAVTPSAVVETMPMDLSSLVSVAEFGTAMRADGRPIHILVNNAGVMTPPDRQETTDGFEVQFGTNHLGHVALLAHLFPQLRAGNARVTSQVSVAASRGEIHWDDLQWRTSYDGMAAYRQSKIALGMFALELERRSREGDWGIVSNLSHPGVAPTSLLAARPEIGRSTDTLGVRVIRWLSARGLIVGTPVTAAQTALQAVTAPGLGGVLYGPSGVGNLGGPSAEQKLYRPLQNAQDARRMWDESLALVGAAIPE